MRTIGPCLNVERIIEKFVIKYNGARRADNNPCHLIITETVSVAVNRASAQGLLIFTTCPKRERERKHSSAASSDNATCGCEGWNFSMAQKHGNDQGAI